jgi:hypothetical protein
MDPFSRQVLHDVHRLWPKGSRARVVVTAAAHAEVNRIALRVLGRTLDPQDYADLAGAPNDALVRVVPLHGMLRLEMVQEDAYGYCGAQLLFRNRRGALLVCGGYRILDPQLRGRCLVLAMFQRQVVAATRLGLHALLAIAERGPGNSGYYVWPRLGFDAALPPRILRILPRALRHARHVLDLMRSIAGRNWWRRRGVSLDVAFDLRPGSRSWSVFRRYLEEHAAPLRPAFGCQPRRIRSRNGASGLAAPRRRRRLSARRSLRIGQRIC